MKKGTASRLQGGEREVARVARVSSKRESASRQPSARPSAGHERIGVDERQQQVAAQQVGPPVGLRVAREREREVREPAASTAGASRRAGQRRAARPARAARGSRASPQSVTSKPGERVPGRRRAPSAVPPRARGRCRGGSRAGSPRRPAPAAGYAAGELAREADVEGRVERDERIEQELAGSGVDAVPGVLGHGQERDEARGRGRGHRAAAGRVRSRAGRGRGATPAQEDRREQPPGRAAGTPVRRLNQ